MFLDEFLNEVGESGESFSSMAEGIFTPKDSPKNGFQPTRFRFYDSTAEDTENSSFD